MFVILTIMPVIHTWSFQGDVLFCAEMCIPGRDLFQNASASGVSAVVAAFVQGREEAGAGAAPSSGSPRSTLLLMATSVLAGRRAELWAMLLSPTFTVSLSVPAFPMFYQAYTRACRDQH